MVPLTAFNVNDCGPSSLYERAPPYGSHSPLRPLSQSAAALSLIIPDEPLTGTASCLNANFQPGQLIGGLKKISSPKLCPATLNKTLFVLRL